MIIALFRGALVAQIDLDLPKVLTLFEQMGGVAVAQSVDVGGLLDAAGLERQAKGALECGAAEGLGGGGTELASVALGREEHRGMTMSLPLLPQELQGALGQRNVTVLVALALADVQEHASGVDVAHLQANPSVQAQAAGVDGG